MEIDRAYARIYLNHILHNYRLIQSLANTKDVLAIVKADAYGHGAQAVAKMLEENGCRFFAVACLKEAIELRKAGIQSEILIFGKTVPENINLIHQFNLIQTIDSLDYAKTLNQASKTIRVHANIDTGMSRFGFYLHKPEQTELVFNELKQVRQLDYVSLEGVYTHFADADNEQSDFSIKQFDLFGELLQKCKEAGWKDLIRHASNSAASIRYPNFTLDMVRLGIAMYGYPPVSTQKEFLPGMGVYARVNSVRKIDITDTVSYGRTYQPTKKERIATLAIGYADGYNRLLSNQDYVMFKGNKLSVIGRVCMDLIMVKIDDVEIEVGDYVEIFGKTKDLMEMCQTLKTIPYELLCNISKRVPRIYHK